MLRYVFMGSPEIAATILKHLAEVCGAPVHIYTQPPRMAGRGQKLSPTPVQLLCEQRGWGFSAPEKIETEEQFQALRDLQPDLILVAAFGQILKQKVLDIPKKGCLNVHASLLPKYRGAAPFQRAILDGDKTTGITIQRIVKKLDAGDILVQKEIPILRKETSTQLLSRLAELGAQGLVEAVQLIANGKDKYTPQEESQATYAKKLEKSEGKIDWNRSALEIERQVYGMQPWPTAETKLGKDRLQVFHAEAVDLEKTGTPGTIKTDHKSTLQVQCGRGVLALTEIQLENRKRLSIDDFLKGYRGNFPFTTLG